MPLLYHPCNTVLSTDMQMWSKGCILGAKRYTCASSTASCKSLIFTPPLGFVSETSLDCVSREKYNYRRSIGLLVGGT